MEDILKKYIRDLWENDKRSNICTTTAPGKEKVSGAKTVFKEIMVESFPNMAKDIKPQTSRN